MRKTKRHAGNLKLVGGRLCLDFVNTVSGRGTSQPFNYLYSYPELLNWGRHVGILTRQEAESLLNNAEKNPGKAGHVHKRAVELRDALYRLFVSAINGFIPKEHDLKIFNRNVSNMMNHVQIKSINTKLILDVHGQKDKLDWLLNPIIWSAVELFIYENLKKVKICNESRCSWLFWDNSRNQSRRWCSMEVCGNRTKARRFYRQKQ